MHLLQEKQYVAMYIKDLYISSEILNT